MVRTLLRPVPDLVEACQLNIHIRKNRYFRNKPWLWLRIQTYHVIPNNSLSLSFIDYIELCKVIPRYYDSKETMESKGGEFIEKENFVFLNTARRA